MITNDGISIAHDAESSRQVLFVYGTLMPRDLEEARRDGAVADAVRGRLFDLGPYPGLTDVSDQTAPWVNGFVRLVPLALLRGRLDDYEGVPQRLYRRVSTRARSGRQVWVYVYDRPLPQGARGPLPHWEGRRGAWDLFSLEDPIE